MQLKCSILLFFLLITSIGYTQITKETLYKFPEKTGTIQNKTLDEISGMAPSRYQSTILWMINDSGNKSELHAVKLDGTLVATYQLNVDNEDWEDMSAFQIGDTSYLVIGDIGDNDSVRKTCHLYFLKEPDINKTRTGETIKMNVDWTIHFTYADGPKDCESLAVDTKNSEILLLSKRKKPPAFYKIPLLPFHQNRTDYAEKIMDLVSLPSPSKQDMKMIPNLKYGNQPTSMDISPVTGDLVVQTYKTAYLFKNHDNKESRDLDHPLPMTLPPLRQGEAICFGQDGKSIFVTSEKIPAPVYHITRKE